MVGKVRGGVLAEFFCSPHEQKSSPAYDTDRADCRAGKPTMSSERSEISERRATSEEAPSYQLQSPVTIRNLSNGELTGIRSSHHTVFPAGSRKPTTGSKKLEAGSQ